jgi:hypothetical protein
MRCARPAGMARPVLEARMLDFFRDLLRSDGFVARQD